MDAPRALADLVEISQQIESAVLASRDGDVLASTLADEGRAESVAEAARELLEGAAGPAGEPVQVRAVLPSGSVFVVADGERLVAAVTSRDPTVGLVFYDLKTCLRLAGEEPDRPKKAAASGRKRAAKADEEGGDGAA